MGLDVGGTTPKPDWPKLGPSLLIATSLILAIRTAKRPIGGVGKESEVWLDPEISYCSHLAGAVLMYLVMTKPDLFPHVNTPWFVPGDEDTPR